MSNLPVLAQSSFLRLLTVSVMYFAQGIQTAVILVAIPAYLAANGLEAGAIARFVGVIMLPWSFKIIAGPLMDRYSFLPMGRRRPWVLLSMFGVVAGFLAMAGVTDPLQNLSTLMIMGLIVSSSTAFMDVAIDGLTVDIMNNKEIATANALMNGSNAIGFALNAAISAWAMNQFGLSTTLFWIGIVIGCLTLVPLLFREQLGERLFFWSKGQAASITLDLQMESWRAIFRNLFKVLFLPSSLLLIAASFLIGTSNGYLKTFLPILTVQELEWTNTDYSNLLATASLVAGILGMLIGGFLMTRLGTVKGAIIFASVLLLAGVAMALMPSHWTNATASFIFVVYIFRTLFLIGLFTACMQICWKPVAATQFSTYMAISNLGISFGALLFGWLQGDFSYAMLFVVFAGIIGLLLLALVQFYRTSFIE